MHYSNLQIGLLHISSSFLSLLLHLSLPPSGIGLPHHCLLLWPLLLVWCVCGELWWPCGLASCCNVWQGVHFYVIYVTFPPLFYHIIIYTCILTLYYVVITNTSTSSISNWLTIELVTGLLLPLHQIN